MSEVFSRYCSILY